MQRILRFFIERPFINFLLVLALLLVGLAYSPFQELRISWLNLDAVKVDAIPDLGENQQIIQVNWPGRSPQDVDEYITYPLSSRLLGIAGVKSIRSSSMLGLSTIYLIFDEDNDYYDSRSRILEKLSSLPSDVLPDGVQPQLGPDATALGQIFWYTLESYDQQGNEVAAWGLDSLRTVQDYFVKDLLSSVEGVSEVASIGGFVREYQIMPILQKMENYEIGLLDLAKAVRSANMDVGARTLEINRAEYLIRGLGAIREASEIGKAVIKVRDGLPIRVEDVAIIQAGPAERRGVLDKNGTEKVGGVVVARFDANPAEVIEAVKTKIAANQSALPSKMLNNGKRVQMRIVPFYDRSILIGETLDTLLEALELEILITVLVILLLLRRLRVSLLVASVLPFAVLVVFIGMKWLDITANIVALSGIAIAIGTMVDLGIIMSEAIEREAQKVKGLQSLKEAVFRGAHSVSKPILTAVATTVISFLPVFALEAAEGKLFTPLAWTKTLGLVAALGVCLLIIPGFSLLLHRWSRTFSKKLSLPDWTEWLIIALLLLFLSISWQPLGPTTPFWMQFLVITLPVVVLWSIFYSIQRYYLIILRWSLQKRGLVYLLFVLLVLGGMIGGLGYSGIFSPIYSLFPSLKQASLAQALDERFPGLPSEFMPALDEGEFLLMPTSMPHAGIQQNQDVLRILDMAVAQIPEIEYSVGKLGRVESALDPAPISMYENVIRYKAEYTQNEQGEWVRQWRDHIKSPDDIWQEISAATQIPGVTGAPKLQPIETRLVMLQSGMRAPMGIRIKGESLEQIQAFGEALEPILKEVEGVKAGAVFAERVVGKPYLNLAINREAIALHGLSIENVQQQLQTAIAGMEVGQILDGRARFPIRVRYPREERSSPDELKNIFIRTPMNYSVRLGELVDIQFERGPQMIRREETFFTSYVLFDRLADYSAGEVAEKVMDTIKSNIEQGTIKQPASLSYEMAGSWEQQQRAESRLKVILPLVLLVILAILYLQFKHMKRAFIVLLGVLPALSGGLLLLLALHHGWFSFMEGVNLSVAVWVGFIALFGIATDDSVLMGSSILDHLPNKAMPDSYTKRALLVGASRRIRPAVMTTLTTILALLPVLSSSGKGSDIMIPMAIPIFGGMLLAAFNWVFTPVMWSHVMKNKDDE